MKFQKGRSKTGGRKKGISNKVTLDLREKISMLLSSQFDQIVADFFQMEPKDRINAWIRLLEYSLQKLQRSESHVNLSNMSDSEIDELFERAISKMNNNE